MATFTLDINSTKYEISDIEDVEKMLRLNPAIRDEMKTKVLHLCFNDPTFLQTMTRYGTHSLQRLVSLFPEQRQLLLTKTFEDTTFIENNIKAYNFEQKQVKKNTLHELLAAFPENKDLILSKVLGNVHWLKETMRFKNPVWVLKNLSEQFPDYKQLITDTVFSSKELQAILLPALQALQQNTSLSDLSPKDFYEKMLEPGADYFTKINTEAQLDDAVKLFPKDVLKLLHRVKMDDDFLRSMNISAGQLATFERILSSIPYNNRTEVFEELFNKTNVIAALVNREKLFNFNVFNSFVSMFPNSRDKIFDLMFAQNQNPPDIGLVDPLINLIDMYPDHKAYFYEKYLADEKRFNDFIMQTDELVKLMKRYPERQLTFLERAFTNETFISWRGFRTSYDDSTSDHHYITKLLNQDPFLKNKIFAKAFGSRDLMSAFCSSKIPADLIADLNLLVHYFPEYSKEIFSNAFPNPKTLEERLVSYNEYAPQLADVFPNVSGIREGSVYDANGEINFIPKIKKPTNDLIADINKTYENTPKFANTIFSYFNRAKDLVKEELQHVSEFVQRVSNNR